MREREIERVCVCERERGGRVRKCPRSFFQCLHPRLFSVSYTGSQVRNVSMKNLNFNWVNFVGEAPPPSLPPQ